ncbi:MAG TPA: VCBS domain-containing protein [Dongiaceae bacterium]|nr:VCBS domain-containing protein [Dongiaceae bacterium]
MAETITTAGLITSFGNTPQANTDEYYYTEDSSSFIWLDVMSNDLGGKAKTLYSIDTDVNDLLQKDVVGVAELSALGAKISIGTDDGKVKVKYEPNGAFDYLAAGETATDTFQYAIRLANGALSWDTVTITITGTNDGPVLSDTSDPAAVAEALNASAQDLIAINGTFSVTDLDVGDTLTPSVVGGPVVKLDGLPFILPAGASALTAATAFTLTGATSNGGAVNIGYGYNPGAANLDFLRAGQSLTIIYQVKVNDGTTDSATQDVTFTITGTNDAPVLSDTTDPVAVLELGNASAQNLDPIVGSFAVSDLDVGDTLTASIVGSPVVKLDGVVFALPAGAAALTAAGAFSIAPLAQTSTGGAGTAIGYTYDPAAANLDFLRAGQSLTIIYQVKVNDGTTDSATQDVTFTITGTNDAPVLDGSKTPVLDSENQGSGAPSGTVGTLVSNLIDLNPPAGGLDNVTDQDNGAVTGIALTNVDTTNGTWFYSLNGGTTWIAVGTVTNASALLLAADANTRLYFQPNSGFSGTDTNAITFRAWDQTGSGIAGTKVDTTTNGGTTAFSAATDTANITINPTSIAPVVDLNGSAAGNNATFGYPSTIAPLVIASSATVADTDSATLVSLTATLTGQGDNATGFIKEILSLSAAAAAAAAGAGLTVSFTSTVTSGVLSITGTATTAIYQTILDGIQYADTKTGAHSDASTRIVTVVVNDGANDSIPVTVSISVAKPAGVAGEEINLALTDPTADASDRITFKVTGVPAGWTLNAGTLNADGSWSVITADPSALTVKAPSDYTGAVVLNVAASWTNADGTSGSAFIYDNVEVFAQGAPIFAVSAEDHLTGSSGADLFVFGQPISADTLHNFDAVADKIDLIGFDTIGGYGDLVIADDGQGNAIVSLGEGQSITVLGVSASALGADNFVFNVDPVMQNAGTMTISNGALMPLGGTVENTGTIALNGAGALTELEVVGNGLTLNGGGHLTLSDDDNNLIIGSAADAVLTNHDNLISGAGQLGGGQLTLVNAGTILADGAHALVIDTGAATVTNSGLLESTGTGGLIINSDVANTGNIWANGGDVAIHGNVTGSGDATISGTALLDLDGASDLDVLFADSGAQTLQLDALDQFTGTVTGFGIGDILDFADLGADATVLFTADADGSGGTLTVSNGSYASSVNLDGNYQAAGFTGSYQQGVGFVVTYDEAHIA